VDPQAQTCLVCCHSLSGCDVRVGLRVGPVCHAVQLSASACQHLWHTCDVILSALTGSRPYLLLLQTLQQQNPAYCATISPWSRHVTRLYRSVHPWGCVSQRQTIKETLHQQFLCIVCFKVQHSYAYRGAPGVPHTHACSKRHLDDAAGPG